MVWNDRNSRWQQMHDQDGTSWLMVILMLVIAIAVVVAVIALLRGTMPLAATAGGSTGARPDPRAILQERFAHGEIDEQDFRARMRALDDTGPAGG
jgi:putative membrane protein